MNGELWVIQFCCKCKNPACAGVILLEEMNKVRTTKPEEAPDRVQEFLKDFEPQTLACLDCGQAREYFAKDVGHVRLEE